MDIHTGPRRFLPGLPYVPSFFSALVMGKILQEVVINFRLKTASRHSQCDHMDDHQEYEHIFTEIASAVAIVCQ